VGLAAALYASTQTVLLDDPFSALDASTSQEVASFVLSEAYTGDKRCIVVVTHNRQVLESCANIVVLAAGTVAAHGTYEHLQASCPLFQSLVSSDHSTTKTGSSTQSEEFAGNDIEDDHNQADGAEHREHGYISSSVLWSYVQAEGVVLTMIFMLAMTGMQASTALYGIWLSYWAEQSEMSSRRFILVSSIIIAAAISFTFVRAFLFAYCGLRAARRFYVSLTVSVVHTSLTFFEETAIGRIINRFARDTSSIDDALPFWLNILLAQSFTMIGILAVLCYASPILLLPLGVVFLVYFKLQRFYRFSSREIRRLDSVTRSPLFSLLSECVEAASTIRATKREKAFVREVVCWHL
jgi:ATP-binding cassette subfamily C (CFTR/MRP) protein 10